MTCTPTSRKAPRLDNKPELKRKVSFAVPIPVVEPVVEGVQLIGQKGIDGVMVVAEISEKTVRETGRLALDVGRDVVLAPETDVTKLYGKDTIARKGCPGFLPCMCMRPERSQVGETGGACVPRNVHVLASTCTSRSSYMYMYM